MDNVDICRREESPLLESNTGPPVLAPASPSEPPTRTPLPWGQLAIVVLILLVEPLSSQAIYPFVAKVHFLSIREIPQPLILLEWFPIKMVNELGVTKGDTKLTGYYVGFIVSHDTIAGDQFICLR